MKHFIAFLITLLFSTSLFDSLIAQTPDIIRDQRGYLTSRVKKQVYPDNSSQFFSEVNYDYGSYIPANPLTEAKVFVRSIWEFNLPTSLPTGYYVKKVEIKYKGSSSTSFNLGYVSQYPSNPTLEEKWNLIENSTFLKTLAGSNGTYYTYEIPELLEIIRTAHDQSSPKVYLSFRTSSELTNSTFNIFSDLVLIITYDIRYNYYVKNNFETGNLKVNSETKFSGESVRLPENSVNNFEALEPQSTVYYEYLWNDVEAINYKSEWILKLETGIIKNKGQNIIIVDTSVTDRHNSIMTANLRKNLRISRIDDFSEFDNVINAGVVAHVVEQNSGQLSAPPQTVNGKIYVFTGWADNFSEQNPRTITPVENESYTALYKYPHHSNSTTAYSNPSQRKFIQTPDGVKHICYESMGKVWYELSTDNGATWILGNGGKPLSSTDAKNPSMSFYGNQIGIVWQEKSGSSFKIKMALFYGSNYSSSLFSTVAEEDLLLDYSYNANPVVAWGYNAKVVVVWSGFDLCTFAGGTMLKYAYGSASSNDISWYMQCGIAGTDANSINPTIVANYSVNTSPFYFHIAWEQVVNSSTSKINYSTLSADANNYLQHTAFEEASYNSGYSKNYQPSILLRKVGDYYLPYIAWLGYRSTPPASTRVATRYKQYGSWSPLSIYGGDLVQSYSINNSGLLGWQDVLGLGWSEPIYAGSTTYFNKAVKIGSSTTINTLSTTGKDLQINNSNGLASMNVNSFQSKTIPYSFSLSQPFISLSKENSLAIFNGREGVVGKNGAQFFFALGDISINGQNINFITVPDSVNINSLEAVNEYFASEPFTVDENSSLIYGVQYGITDSVLCAKALAENEQIGFKVELLDNQTNEVLGVFDEVTYSVQNVYQYNNLGYQVNLNGIGNREVKFRLVVSTNSEFGYSLSNRLADQSLLAKNSYQTVSYHGNLAVTDYALEQNYPNPFNPSTKIKFQLPKDGFVTLKVYDILGKEITTLINEEKSQGKYEVNFNASSLSSGVYIYKIQAGDFSASKKLILLK